MPARAEVSTGRHTQESASPSADPRHLSPDQPQTKIADGFNYYKITEKIKERIVGISFPEKGAKITFDDLRYLRLKYYDFNGNAHEDGELIVNKDLAREVAEIFYQLFLNQYPFTSVRLVDDFGEPGDDNLSMAANNTSAFNYRYVTGTDILSQHSYGRAIDVNPRMNPYITDGRVAPENAEEYSDRSKKLPGMIDHEDICYQLFNRYGWTWGGDSTADKDYQHFSKKQD